VGRRAQWGRVLSPREREVLRWLIRGLSRAQIAARLGVGQETVKTQQRAIYRKLGAAGRHEVAALAWRAGPGGGEARWR
jgi:LuxR family transcriptional regulator, maltose regulon positive regulatory protein